MARNPASARSNELIVLSKDKMASIAQKTYPSANAHLPCWSWQQNATARTTENPGRTESLKFLDQNKKIVEDGKP